MLFIQTCNIGIPKTKIGKNFTTFYVGGGGSENLNSIIHLPPKVLTRRRFTCINTDYENNDGFKSHIEAHVIRIRYFTCITLNILNIYK